jgi:hypothetical protein
MPYIPLKLPPGVYSNGTKYQSKGRWYSANLIRWSEGVMEAVGGWLEQVGSVNIDVTDPIRGVFNWRDDSDAVRFLYGTHDKLYHFAAGTETDVTPAVFTAGVSDATLTAGQYDVDNYDTGKYGEGDEASATLTEANTWQFDNYGPIPIACAYSDGQILDWDLNVANNFVAVTNAPTSCRGVVVTPERIIVALGAGGDPRKLSWSDQADRTIWSAASTNTAGDYFLPGQGELQCGKRLPTETIILTDVDAFAMRWIGGSLIYRIDAVGNNCGAVSRQALTTAEGRAFWMSKRGFFKYEGGFAQPIPCPISDSIFDSLNTSQRSKVAAWANARFHEVWFSYPVSDECDRVVSYNYLENHWSGPWDLERTSGMDAGAYTFPILADASGQLYEHENGHLYLDTDGSTDLAGEITAETGPIEIGAGDRVMMVRRYVPDEDTVGDCDMDLYAALYPTADEDSQTSITIGELTSTRLTGRQVRLKLTQVSAGWQFGVPRLEVVQRGRR